MSKVKNSKKSLIAGFIVALVVVLGFWLPSPYLLERPGPTVDALGQVELEGETRSVVSVAGSEQSEHGGEIRLLTVSVVGNPDNRLGWFALLPALVDKTQSLIPMEQIYGDGVSKEDRENYNAMLMDDSQMVAAAAALREAGQSFDSTVIISAVPDSSPSAGLFREGDIFLSVNGVAVESSTEFRSFIAAQDVGTQLDFMVLRDNEEKAVTVTTVEGPDRRSSMIGVLLFSEYEFPIDIEFALEGIGGPSAGLVFALAIYEKLSDRPVVGDLRVSATGTVDEVGNVGAIGGLTQKAWGAKRAGSEIFLFPKGNCSDLPTSLPKGMTSIPVDSLSETIHILQNIAEFQEIDTFAACDEVLARS